MKLAEVSIKRPVFATMVIASIVVFGVVLYGRLSVDMFPNVNPPIVTIVTIYPGASPETMESQVAEPIEEALGTLGGVRMMRSVCLGSVTQVILEFDLDLDIDTVIQDVRDRVAGVELPDGAEEPSVAKLDLGAAPVLQLAVTGSADPAELARYAEDVLQAGIQRIEGVGQVELIGNREREIHVYIDPAALRSHGLTVLEVIQSLGAQNLEIPGGRIERGGQELVLRTDARAGSAEDLEELAIMTIPMGGVIRLGDVARVVDGLEEARSVATVNGRPALALVVRKQSGANTVAVAAAVQEALPALQRQAPTGAEVRLLIDDSSFIRSSVDAVEFDLVLGAFLAVAIIFVFLRDPRATIISALALPTSVIGTFVFVYAMGFTINMMTTMALSLSIGILVDDAIVVIENIARRRTKLGESPMDAAYRGTSEIGLAVLATTMSIVAVFVPVSLTEGMVGKFFYEFGLTVAFAVLLSLFVSFTLTPMLSSRFLKTHDEDYKPRGLSGLVGRLLDGLDGAYRRAITWVLRHRVVTIMGAVGALVGTVFIAPLIGMTFMPTQDRGQFNVTVEMPAGTALDETSAEARRIAVRLRELPGVESTYTRVGGGMRAQVNVATILVSLVHRDERAFTEEEASGHIRRMLEGRADRLVYVEPLSMFGGGMGRFAPIQVEIQGDDLEVVGEVATKLANQMRETPGFADVDTTLRLGTPELRVEVDRARAADVGVLGAQVAMTVRYLVAGQVATRLDTEGERHDVRVQLPPEERTSVRTVESAQIRTPANVLVDVGSVARVVEDTGPAQIDRQDRERLVAVYANLEGLAMGDALALAEEMIPDDLPPGVTYQFGGMGQEFQDTLVHLGTALLLAIICVYMILAAQFESFVHPFTIMVSLPFSVIGALGALLIMGEQMHIMAMIGFIMLMGLVTKNAILLVDFANQLRAEGKEMVEALIEAGAIRLRPILMTTAAMIFGMLPVAIGHGDGGEMRAAMGMTVIGGLITSTFLTLLVVPVFYTMMDAVGRGAHRVFGLFSRKKKSELVEETS